jgi:hypothetical protein
MGTASDRSGLEETANRRPQRQPLRCWLVLLFCALAMELVYARMFVLHDLKKNVVEFIPLVLGQGILYVFSVYLAEKVYPARSHLALIFAAATVFRLTLLPLYPSLSDDLYRYSWDARAQQAGYNPYLVHPSDPALSALRGEQQPAGSGPQYPTLYGPVTEEVLWLSLVLGHGVIAMKLPFLLFDLATVLLLFRLLPELGVSPSRAIVYAWSPLVIVEFAASGHNDSLPIVACVLALLYYQTRREPRSILALSVSALSKLYASFLFPVFLSRTSWRWLWIPAGLAVVTFLPYGAGWRGLLHTLSGYGTVWKNNQSLFLLLHAVAANDSQARAIYLAIVGLVILYCLARKLPPARSSYLILGAILLFSPNVFPWYLSWIVPLLCIYLEPAWLLLTVAVFLSYHVLIPYGTLGLWREDRRFTLLEYAPFYALLLAGYAVRKFPKPGSSSEVPNT